MWWVVLHFFYSRDEVVMIDFKKRSIDVGPVRYVRCVPTDDESVSKTAKIDEPQSDGIILEEPQGHCKSLRQREH